MTVRKPAGERAVVDQAKLSSGSLAIPAAQPYNIVSFKSGQDGAARGEAKPHEGNGATCRVDARDGGNAWAEFQLGYCFNNAAKTPVSAAVKLRLSLTESVSTSPAGAETKPGAVPTTQSDAASSSPSGPSSTAKVFVKFFIKDSNGLVLREQSLLADELEKGPHTSSDTRDVVFDVRFEPERGYYLVVAGRSEAQAASGQSVQAAVDVTQCAMEIVWQSSAGSTPPDASGRKLAEK